MAPRQRRGRSVSSLHTAAEVAEEFGISEKELRKIQEEGIEREWPPLEQAV